MVAYNAPPDKPTLEKSDATPDWAQSRPMMGMTWPRTSDLVMVPSMSETTILSVDFHQ